MKLISILRRLRRNERGNIMYMVAAMLVPILITIGAGVDMSRAYMARGRLQQACDAGVLAGRRAMTGTVFTTEARARAERMFNFNYRPGVYGSRDTTFLPTLPDPSTVAATARTKLPMIIMAGFNAATDSDDFNLSVSCSARFEMPNTDVMMVLDVTGSMNSAMGSETRIAALKREAVAFYDTLAASERGNSRLRLGIVPYSSSVNVGSALMALNPSYIANTSEIPSRTIRTNVVASSGPSITYENVSGWSSYSNTGQTLNNVTSSSNCPTTTTFETSPTGSPVETVRIEEVSSTDRRFITESDQPRVQREFSYTWSYNQCRQRVRSRTYVEETATSRTLRYYYQYRMVEYDTSGLKTGGSLSLPIGFKADQVVGTWNGCVRERATQAFSASSAVPSGAIDLDVDRIPSDDDTRWRAMVPAFTYPRAVDSNGWPVATSASPEVYEITTNLPNYAASSVVNGGFPACPTAVTPLRTFERADFVTAINGLSAVGGTYHDAGMAWGARMISPTGPWRDTNATAPNNLPISRHILFMTDGLMSPDMRVVSHQGQESLERRVLGNADPNQLTARHNARLLALCDAAKARNITIWFVSFGPDGLDETMRSCASGDRSFAAANSAELRTQFQNIAKRIARLRLQS